MGLNTRSFENALHLQYELTEHRNAIVAHGQRVMLANAILYSPAAKAIMSDTQELFDACFEGVSDTRCEPIYWWMISLGAQIMDRVDHAFQVLHTNEFDGNIMNTYEYLQESVMSKHTDDYKYGFEFNNGHWCFYTQADCTVMGKPFQGRVEIGFMTMPRRGCDVLTPLEIEMYERVAKVFITQHWKARLAKIEREGLDFSYDHDNDND
jgi:hypothetical protein